MPDGEVKRNREFCSDACRIKWWNHHRLNHSFSAQISYYIDLIQKNPEWEHAGVYAGSFLSGTSTKNRTKCQQGYGSAPVFICFSRSGGYGCRIIIDSLSRKGSAAHAEGTHHGYAEGLLSGLARGIRESHRTPLRHRGGAGFYRQRLATSQWPVRERMEVHVSFRHGLSYGAEGFYDGWMKNPRSAIISCNNGFRPVSFLLEAMEEPTKEI